MQYIGEQSVHHSHLYEVKLNTQSPWIQVVRWLVGFAGIIYGLCWLNHAAFCTWAASGPPSPHPELWRAQARQSAAICALAVTSSVIFIASLRRKRHANGEQVTTTK